MDLKETIYQLEREIPNNMELGNAIRALVWKMKEAQSQEIADAQVSGQLDLFK